MVVKICPRCQVRYIVNEDVEDFIHNCGDTSPSEVLKNEDVVVVGDWSDYTGSDIEVGAQSVMLQGIGNKIFVQRGWLEGEKPADVTSRGNDTATHRTRRHLEFIKLK